MFISSRIRRGCVHRWRVPSGLKSGVRTGLVWTTSFSVRFIHVSQLTRWPLRVSPFLSSTSIGWPWAALRRPRGSCKSKLGQQGSNCWLGREQEAAMGCARGSRARGLAMLAGPYHVVFDLCIAATRIARRKVSSMACPGVDGELLRMRSLGGREQDGGGLVVVLVHCRTDLASCIAPVADCGKASA